MNCKHVSVVIPVHNRRNLTRQCLQCLQEQTYEHMSVIVVDDGSTDGTPDMLQAEFPEVVRLEGDGNMWWTASTNMGVEYALNKGAELVLTLNNDVIIKGDYIQKHVEAHYVAPEALIGSINLTQDERPRLLYAGIISRCHWTCKSVRRGSNEQPYEDTFHGLMPSYSLPGRGVLVPSEVFARIGLYDTKAFPHYAADIDFLLRAQKFGYDILINLDNPVYSPYEPVRPGFGRGSRLDVFKSFVSFRTPNYWKNIARMEIRHNPHKWYLPVALPLKFVRYFLGSFNPRQ